jgi:hypothetical protein
MMRTLNFEHVTGVRKHIDDTRVRVLLYHIALQGRGIWKGIIGKLKQQLFEFDNLKSGICIQKESGKANCHCVIVKKPPPIWNENALRRCPALLPIMNKALRCFLSIPKGLGVDVLSR